jgi:hypothetical protein
MKTYFCEKCGHPVFDAEIEEGIGKKIGDIIYCYACAEKIDSQTEESSEDTEKNMTDTESPAQEPEKEVSAEKESPDQEEPVQEPAEEEKGEEPVQFEELESVEIGDLEDDIEEPKPSDAEDEPVNNEVDISDIEDVISDTDTPVSMEPVSEAESDSQEEDGGENGENESIVAFEAEEEEEEKAEPEEKAVVEKPSRSSRRSAHARSSRRSKTKRSGISSRSKAVSSRASAASSRRKAVPETVSGESSIQTKRMPFADRSREYKAKVLMLTLSGVFIMLGFLFFINGLIRGPRIRTVIKKTEAKEMLDQARKLKEKGIKLYNAGQYDRALDNFYESQNLYETLINEVKGMTLTEGDKAEGLSYEWIDDEYCSLGPLIIQARVMKVRSENRQKRLRSGN